MILFIAFSIYFVEVQLSNAIETLINNKKCITKVGEEDMDDCRAIQQF